MKPSISGSAALDKSVGQDKIQECFQIICAMIPKPINFEEWPYFFNKLRNPTANLKQKAYIFLSKSSELYSDEALILSVRILPSNRMSFIEVYELLMFSFNSLLYALRKVSTVHHDGDYEFFFRLYSSRMGFVLGEPKKTWLL